MALKYTLSLKKDILIVSIAGRVDSFGADDLREAFSQVLSKKKNKVLVQMGALDYIDSKGVGAIVTFVKLIRERGGTVKIAETRPNVRHIFNLLSLNRLLDFYTQTDEALAAFDESH